MRVAITGAAGFIGGHLCHALSPGHEILAIDNCRSGDWTRLPGHIQQLNLDINGPSAAEWSQLLRGSEVLYHLAAEKYNSSRSTPQRVIDTNISAMARLLEGAAAAGVKKTVFTSSLYAYGSLGPEPMREDQPLKPTTFYGMSKVAGENLLRVAEREYGTAWACARLFFVYGTHQYAEGGYKSVIMRNFERMLGGEPPVINGSGHQRLDYVYVDDAVRALITLSAEGTKAATVNIGSGHAPTIRELTDLMMHVAGWAREPAWGPADWTEGSVRVADARRAREMIGWSSSTPLESGLRAVWDWITRDSADAGDTI